MYERYCQARDKAGLKDSDVARIAGISRSTLSDWKAGAYEPKRDKLEKIATALGVSVHWLMTGDEKKPTIYYMDERTAQTAQELFDDPDLHALFDTARGCSPEDIRLAEQFLRRMKETNPDG